MSHRYWQKRYVRHEEVRRVIEAVGKQLHSEVISVKQEMTLEHLTPERFGVRCDIHTAEHFFQDLWISLPGLHQAENAATAILAAFQLAHVAGTACTSEGIKQGVQQVRWPGRAQLIQQQPWVLLDGAINREAAEQIAALVKVHPANRLTAVVCVPTTVSHILLVYPVRSEYNRGRKLGKDILWICRNNRIIPRSPSSTLMLMRMRSSARNSKNI